MICYFHNIMTFCSEACFDSWFYETKEGYIERNKRMFGVMIDGRIIQYKLLKA